MKKGGFTLIELMIVIAIIGFITAISMPNFIDLTKDAQVAQIQGNESNLRTALNMYIADTGNDVGSLFGEGEGPGHITDGKEEYTKGWTRAMDREFNPFYKYWSKDKLPHLPSSVRWRAVYMTEEALHGSGEPFDSESFVEDEYHYGWIFTDRGNVYPMVPESKYGLKYDEFI